MRTDENGLNDRWRHFASLIVAGATATRAYKMSFSTCKTHVTAEVEGCRLLKNPKVAAYIKKLRDEDNEKLALDRIISKQETLEFLTQVIRTPAGAIDKNDPLCQSFKDTEREYEIKLPDKLRAEERICHKEPQIRYLLLADIRRLLAYLKSRQNGYGSALAFHLANALFPRRPADLMSLTSLTGRIARG
jgi:hypothetical protein